ncbi:MAG: response regulator transcription factor [Paludibacteraceae bacterium]|nr:response regulator transcription factor [Paludibacteraceae bacterium]
MNFIIADNQELTRYAIERLLDEFDDKKIAYASCKAELVGRMQENERSVIILDYTLFDFFDVDNLLIVTQRIPTTNWILLSDDLTESFLRSVVYQSHNISILFKDASLREVKDAIQMAVRGQRYISQRITEILLSQQSRETAISSTLTPTEVEVIRSIAQGKTTKEIAAERYSSIHTINTHRKNIFRKLGVNTAHEAIKRAIRSGLIDESEYFI